MFEGQSRQFHWASKIPAVLVAVVLFMGTPGVLPALELADRHLPIEPLPTIRFSSALSYEEYITQARALIKTRNPRATEIISGGKGVMVVDAIAPKQWPMDAGCDRPKLGILLIHGLSDSPYLIGDLGDHFNRNCVLVRSILLPGHSTLPGDLGQVSYQQWIDASSWAMESFSGQVERLVVVGFSTGATLAIDYTIRNQDRESKQVPLLKAEHNEGGQTQTTHIAGLVLLSPAISINTSAAFLARWVDVLGSLFSERLRWASVAKDLDFAKYESFHMNAAAQVHMLTKRLGSSLDMKHPIPVSVFVVASEQDTTIDTRETIQFFHNRTDQRSNMLLYASQNIQTGDSRIEVRNSGDANKNILSLSHISIPISPANPHYGEKADYVNCLHYSDDSQLSSCLDMNNSAVLYGEITGENKTKGTLRRISWNPDYEYMVDRIDQFIKAL